MKTKINFIIWVSLVSLIYTACQEFENNGNLITVSQQSGTILVRTDSASLTQQQIDKIDYYVAIMADSSASVIKRIAASNFSDIQLDTLSEAVMLSLFTSSEIRAITDSLSAGRDYLDQIIGDEYCSNCSYSANQLLQNVRDLAQAYRDDPEDFDLRTNPNARKFGDNPGCSFGFYICLAGCAGITSGIGAVACVYVCACSFCEYKPPGC